jgi:hypothetical protein
MPTDPKPPFPQKIESKTAKTTTEGEDSGLNPNFLECLNEKQ